ncbi:MAG: hypothetical protein KKD74_01745 [Bacteroidetes bacterium]|nr:hypothetical protein [Bacteroidota bacterium]
MKIKPTVSVAAMVLACLVIIGLFAPKLSAQCCSMGSPVSTASLAGVGSKHTLSVNYGMKYGLFETYFRQRTRLINYGLYDQLSYLFSSFNLAYNFTNRLSFEHELGYFVRKTTRYADPELDKLATDGYGFSGGMLLGKYALWVKPVSQFEIDAGLGFRYPFSRKPMVVNGIELPTEAQPSTGAFGGVMFLQAIKQHRNYSFALQHRYEFFGQNDNDYQYGSAHLTSVSASARYHSFSAVLLLRNEIRTSDHSATNSRLASEGSHLVVLAPQLSYALLSGLNLTMYMDIPIYRYYFGEQISNRYAMGFSIIYTHTFAKPDSKLVFP